MPSAGRAPAGSRDADGSVARRRVLSLAGAALATTTGCNGFVGDDGQPSRGGGPFCPAPERPPEATLPAPGEGRTVDLDDARSATVSFVGLFESVRTRAVRSSVHVDVAVPPGEQFVVATVEVRDDGERTTPTTGDEPLTVSVDGERNPAGRPVLVDAYGWEPDGTTLGFPVPVASADAAALTWTGDGGPARWDLPPAIRSALGRAPAFVVERFETPASVPRGDAVPVRLAVRNEGDRDGRFLAEFGVKLVSDVGEISFSVPAGETVERCFEVTPSNRYADVEELPVVLFRGDLNRRRTVALGGASTTSG
jgi:hypothetical protein